MNHTVNIIYKQIKVEAFTVYDYYHLYPKFLDIVLPYIREGKITYVEDIAKGLKNDPATPEAMFKGRSAGKQERSQRTVERFDFLVFFGLLFGSPEIESRIHLRMILGELSLVVIHQY